MTITDRYIARLILTPLLSMLGLSIAVLLLENMLRLFDFVIDEGGPVDVVWQMLANLLPAHLSVALPLALLLGVLLAFRKLANEYELDILRSSGLGYWRLLRVPYAFTAAMVVVNIFVIGFAQPLGIYNYENLVFELRSGAMGKMMKVGEYNLVSDRIALRFDESFDDGRSLKNVFISANDGKGLSFSATATGGQFLITEDLETIVLRLSDGVLVHESGSFAQPRVLTFDRHEMRVPFPTSDAFRVRYMNQYEGTLPELLRVARDPTATQSDRRAAESNLHFRLAVVAGMLYIPLLAFGLAIPPRRSSSSLGVFLSIIILVAQFKILQNADKMSARGDIDPWLGIWGSYSLFALFAVWVYYIAAYVPGGQPISWLERFATWVGEQASAVSSLFKHRARRAEV